MSTTRPDTSSSTSSQATEHGIRSEDVVKLGKKIVDQLNTGRRVSVLEAWMAHYLARLITEAESAAGEDRVGRMAECFDTILRLWAHRRELPDGKRPFEQFEPILEALARLHPDGSTPLFFGLSELTDRTEKANSEAALWCRMATEVDRAARMLIRYCLASAVQHAVDESRDWVKLAKAVRGQLDYDVVVVGRVIRDVDCLESNEGDTPTPIEHDVLIEALRQFVALAHTVARDLDTESQAV